MAVVDTLVTRYVLDSKDYKQGAGDVQAATGRLVGQFEMGIGAVKGLAVGFGAAAAAIIGGAGMAVKAANDWEVLNAQLEVVTGSFKRAREVAQFAKDLAIPSAFFNTLQLGEGAKMLEAMQLRTERYLPLASTMASIFKQSEEGLMGFISALGRMKAGSFGEAFERMREFGIDAKALAAEGINFKNGQFQLLDGETQEQAATRALDAIEKIIKTRFGKMDETMGKTGAAIWASFGDAWNQGLIVGGEAITKHLNGPLGKFVQQFTNFVNGPTFAALAEKFANMVNFDSIKDNAIKMFTGIIAAFNQMPGIIKGMQRMLEHMWKVATQAAILYLSVQAGIISAQIIQGIVGIAGAFIKVAAAGAAAAASAATLETLLGGIGVVIAGLLVGTAVFLTLQKLVESASPDKMSVPGFDMNLWKADQSQLQQEMSGSLKEQPVGNPAEEARKAALAAAEAKKQKDADAKQSPQQSELEQQTGYLAAIERNTSPERNQILGGGSIGAMGVTPQELGRATGRGKLDAAVKLIAEYVSDAQAKSGADFLKMANPFIGGR